MNNLKCAWCRITVCAMASIALAGCTKNEISAPISSLGGNLHASSYNGNCTDKRASKSVEPYALAAISSGTQVKAATKSSIIYNRRYKTIQKGSSSGTAYQVKWSDTLFYIAWITGNDYRDLAYTYRNKIFKPYNLNVDQTLQVGTIITSITDNAPSGISTNAIESLLKKSVIKMLPTTAVSTITTTPATVTSTGNKAIIGWRWPTDGKIIDNFSAAEGGNKGVDISGSRGQPILATASGRVVYAGNALRGYGNLIIIKHNDHYLSAYAHNDMLLVHEQQKVKAGQKISTMGSTGTSTTRLHFEIHYKGRSVNPLRYLPQR